MGSKIVKAISWGSDDGNEEAEVGDAVPESGEHIMAHKLQSPTRSPGLKPHGFKTFSSPKSPRKVSFSELEKENKVLLA